MDRSTRERLIFELVSLHRRCCRYHVIQRCGVCWKLISPFVSYRSRIVNFGHCPFVETSRSIDQSAACWPSAVLIKSSFSVAFVEEVGVPSSPMEAATGVDNGSGKGGKSSTFFSRLVGKAKVCNSEDVPNQVVEQQAKRKAQAKAKSPPLVVNHFTTGPSFSRL